MTQISPEIAEKIKKVKEAGHIVRKVKLGSREFIYRSISRLEFSKLQSEVNKMTPEGEVTAEQMTKVKDKSESSIVATCLVFPEIQSDMDLDQVIVTAGTIPTLSELIMEASDFGAQPQVEDL